MWFDLGPHLIDQALHLFGLPHAVNASFGILRKGGRTDDWAHVQLIYDHLRVVLHASLLVSGGGPRSVLHGTRGSWAKFGADVQERQLISGMLPDDAAFGHDPDPGIVYDGATGMQTEVLSPVGNQRGYYAGIRDAVLGKCPVPVPVKDAIATSGRVRFVEVLVEWVLMDDVESASEEDPEAFTRAAKQYKIDVAGVRKAVEKEFTAKDAKAAAKTKRAVDTAKPRTGKTDAAKKIATRKKAA